MLRSVVTAAVAFATGVVVARGLGPADTGIYALVVWIALATTIVFAHGLALTLNNLVAQKDVETESGEIAGSSRSGSSSRCSWQRSVRRRSCWHRVCSPMRSRRPDRQELFALIALFVAAQALMDLFSAPINALERQGLLVPLKTIWVVAHLVASMFVLYVVDWGLTALVSGSGRRRRGRRGSSLRPS